MKPSLLALLLFCLTLPAYALPPREFTAAGLGAASGVAVIDDWAPIYNTDGGRGKRTAEQASAVPLRLGGRPLRLDCGALPVGLYYFDIDLRLDRDLPVADRAETPFNPANLHALRDLPRVRRPIYLHCKINDGPAGAINDYRMLIGYEDSYRATSRFFFHVDTPTKITGELRIGPDSLENLRIRKVTLVDFFDGISRARNKRAPMLFTVGERTRQRAAEINRPGYRKPENTTSTAAARQQRDDLIWNALPRDNTQHHYTDYIGRLNFGAPTPITTFDRPAEVPSLKDDAKFKDLHEWALAGIEAKDYHLNAWFKPFEPLTLIDQTSGAQYSAAQLYANEPLPGRPFRETPAGAFFPAEQVPGLGRNHYIFTVGQAMARRYLQFYYSVTESMKPHGPALSNTYYLRGDENAARDASMMLVRWAYQWPAMQIPYQSLRAEAASPDLDYNTDAYGSWMAGKFWYHGWSGPMYQNLLRSYDELYDYIDGNQEFAAAVHRHLPWVNTPDDVIALLDTYLVRAGMKDFRQGRIGGEYSILTSAAAVLGPGPEAAQIFDLGRSEATVYPISGVWRDLISSAINRDGTHYIGSWGYAPIGAYAMLEIARNHERYKAAGGTLRFDLTDVNRFPKVTAAASTLLDATLAGGYTLAVGDASGIANTGRSVGSSGLPAEMKASWAGLCYRLTGDPRYAWIIVNIFGRSDEDDAAWAKLTTVAANTRDPRLHTKSRTLGGFGASIIETGTDFTDPRLKEAVVLRTGTGQGHVHADSLDLNYFALGCRMSTDIATRNEGKLFTDPPSSTSMMHNTVEVDGKNHPFRSEGGWPMGNFSAAEAWSEAFKPLTGAQYMAGSARSTMHKDVSLFRREVAHIAVTPGREGPPAVLPQSYIFDVFRVAGGRWHTWSFHGCVSDDVQVNTALRALPADPSNKVNDPADQLSQSYLRKMAEPKTGIAGDMVEATWRLRRTAETVPSRLGDIKLGNAEKDMLGAQYDEAAPRRFTRVSLFGQAAQHLLFGNLLSESYSLDLPYLFVQRRSETPGQEAVFPSIVEAYQGQPVVVGKKLLPIAMNENDARQAVAIEIKTAIGNTDICFAGGRPEKVRALPGGQRFSGEFAYTSHDAAGLRQATLVGGTELNAPGISIGATVRRYTGAIVGVDYDKRQATFDVALPASLVGEELLIGNADHRTAYTIEAIRTAGNRSTVTFTRTADIARGAVTKVEGDKVTLATMPFAGHEIANRDAGWTTTNEAHTKYWKTKTGWNEMYRLTGEPVALADFTDADGDGRPCVEMYDYGIGDTVTLPTHVSVRRVAGGAYEVQSDVPVRVKIGAVERDLTPDAQPVLFK